MLDVNELLMICERIAISGNTPSVALLRAKSPQKLALPQAIKVVKSYQSGARPNNQESNKIETIEEPAQLSLEQRIQTLELENQHLAERLRLLEVKMAKKT